MAIGENMDLGSILKQFEQLPGAARYGIVAGIVALVVGIYFFTFFGGSRTKLAAVDRQLAKVEQEIQSARNVASNLESFKKQRQELEEQLKVALRKLPNSSDLPQLLTDVSSLAKKSGLEIKTFKRGQKLNRGFYSEQQIVLNFNGQFHDIGVFFDRLSKLSRIVNISKLDMRVIKGTDADPRLAVNGTAATFFFNESNTPDAAGGN